MQRSTYVSEVLIILILLNILYTTDIIYTYKLYTHQKYIYIYIIIYIYIYKLTQPIKMH